MSLIHSYFIFLVLFSSQALAGYRVYEIRLTDLTSKQIPQPFRVEKTTLDPAQYEHYYGVYGIIGVSLMDTWYCPGDTSRRDYCERPKTDPTLGPSSTNPKRRTLPINLQPVIP